MKIKLIATPRGWKADFYHPVTALRIRKVFKAFNKTQADEMLKHFYGRLLSERGALPLRALAIRVCQAAEEYKTETGPRKRPSSVFMDKMVLDSWIVLKGRYEVRDLSEVDAFEFIAMCKGRGLKGATVNRYLNVVRAFYGWSFEKGYMAADLRSRIKPIDFCSRESRRLQMGEIKGLADHAGPTLKLQIRIAATLGLRAAEVASLMWSSIDNERQVLKVGGIASFVTKNGQSREMAVPAKLLNELRKWRLRQLPRRDWVFPNAKGDGPIDSHVVTRSWAKARKRSGLTDVRFHDLRSTAATLFADQGLGDAQVGKAIGHKTASMARKYSRDTTSAPIRLAVAENERVLEEALDVG